MAFEQAVIWKFFKSVAPFFCHAGTIRIQMVVCAAIRIVFVNKKVLQKGVKKVSTFNTQ